MDVSVILPVYNGEKFLDECLNSVLSQTFKGNIELSIYNDASSDQTPVILHQWKDILTKSKKNVVITENNTKSPFGVGYAKNRAIEKSNGKYLCFLDADDVMHPRRLEAQFTAIESIQNEPYIIGSKFHRIPEDSTLRYTSWANNISNSQLMTQIYTSNGPTVIMPTWFCSRQTFDKVGSFNENGKGTPEDLIFFYEHLRLSGKVLRLEEDLLMYRYHPGAESFSISEETIWDIRLKEFTNNVLDKWDQFTIWNAGKQGRKLYRSLPDHLKNKVVAFCDVDAKKISQKFYTYENSKSRPKPKVPIIHYSSAKPPLVICVKQDLTQGGFEENLASLNFKEGRDYYFFS